MGNEQNSESRIDAAIARLEKAAAGALQNRNSAAEVAVGSDLAAENAALKAELDALRGKYEALKRKTQTVSGRLDNSIDQLSMLLEQ
ncbi:MAG: hypothetical protein CMN56_04335 [Sneathiella sp.]|uniref:hypothetical protein n=1 Tax=Sneathiella sp. TaxID=1964365 RepID=UPI000C43E2B4|nr:hypothetical protein [Sneathiella sp.]MAZ02344.1 hypothetical protein [Sneathiella sp.]